MVLLLSFLGFCVGALLFAIPVIFTILMLVVGISCINKDNKARRRIGEQKRQTPNITITFRRDA